MHRSAAQPDLSDATNDATNDARVAPPSPPLDRDPADLADFIAGKGPLRVGEALLCVLYWLDGGGPHRARDLTAHYPRHDGRLIRNPSAPLRHLAEKRLVCSVGDGAYALTPFGRLVVEALPDRAAVGQLRGLRGRAPGPGALRR